MGLTGNSHHYGISSFDSAYSKNPIYRFRKHNSGAGVGCYLDAPLSGAGVGCYLDAHLNGAGVGCYLDVPLSGAGVGCYLDAPFNLSLIHI